MTAANMPACMAEIFRREGGFVDDKNDNGGATNMGITIRTLSAELGRRATVAEVKALTKPDATRIYRRRYWMPVQGDALPAGIDLCVFDQAVHAGPSRAIKTLQGALGVAADGVIGPATMGAVRSADRAALINGMCDLRLAQLRRLDDWQHFGRGWTSRVDGVRDAALLLAMAPSAAINVSSVSPANGKLAAQEIPERPGWLARIIAAMFRR